jgi:hypothetical protein
MQKVVLNEARCTINKKELMYPCSVSTYKKEAIESMTINTIFL